jgi:hypothetical protein
MADKNWLVQSCCNPSISAVVALNPVLSEGTVFQDSLGNCYTVIQITEQIPNIFINEEYLPLYKDCNECTQDSPCIPPYEDTKTWLVQSCCEKGVTKIIADDILVPGDVFQDSLGNCYTVLTSTEGAPNIIRFNESIYGRCNECGKCVSPSPSVTPSLTQTPFPTQTVTPTITVTPSSTTYPLISKTPSATPTATISVTPSPTVSVGSPECKCITFTNPGDIPLYAFYNTCDGLQNIRVQIDNGTSEQYCGGDPTANLGIIITTGSACIGERCVFPDVTPTPTPTPSLTSISGSLPEPDDLCMDVVFGPAPTPSTTPTATVSTTPSVTVSTSTFPIFPSISPSATPSVTPSITPTKTPTISVSTTPSTTPSVTPTRTVTPTVSITKTPTVSITPTKTPTPTPTQSSNALVVPECAVLLISTIGKIYAYNGTTNTSTLLPIPTTFSSDIAHTTNKLWLVTASPTGPNIVEYNITLSPFTATYNRTLPLPVGYTAGAGLCAINDTTLISSIFPPFSTELIVQITLNPDNTTTLTTLFPQIPGRRISGDIVYTTDNKIILTTYTDAPTSYYVSQYALNASGVWTLEFDLNITQNSLYNLGLATINGGIYTFSNTDIKQIGTTFPYNVTQINNTGIIVGGASQIPSCNNVSFQPNIGASPSPTPTPTKTVTPTITVSPSVTPSKTPSKTPTPSPTSNTIPCQGNLPMPGGSTTINGVTIIASGTGNINLYPNPYASCGTTTPGNTPWLGQSATFTYTLTFSQPINNIKLPITGLGGVTTGEIFTFNTNGGIPTITSPNNCLSTISGNTIIGNSPLVGNGGGGLFTFSAPSPFTTLTITGPGGIYGAIVGIDCNSILPAPPADCVSCNIQILPNNGVGTITSGNLTINTTYSGPSLLLLPPGNYSDCTNINSFTNTILLGLNNGAFTYTLTFSQPVNNIKFLMSGGGQSSLNDPQEIFTFNTNGGVPSLLTCGSSCGASINGNQIGLGYTNLGGGSALTQVKATNPYTQIIITGVGLFSNGGTLFSLCLDTTAPLPSPSPSVTPTKTVTPSKTPSVTVTPSKTPSATPSVTPTKTVTPSKTPSPSPGFAANCSTMLYRTQTKGYGSYNFTTNTATALTVAANPYPANDNTNAIPTVIANTSNKMWVYATGATTSEINLRESNITLSPFTSTFSRNITLPLYSKPGNGLFALNNTTLVGTFETFNSSPLNNIHIVELDIFFSTANFTIKCTLPYLNKPVGGLIVTTGANPKLLILTRYGANGPISINQYDYTTGNLEFKKPLPSTIQSPSGLAEVNGNIYIIGSNVYKIDTIAPYNLTLIQNTGNQIINVSQLASCIDTKLPTINCDTCNIGILSQNNILTYNGITIVPSYVGPPSAYPNGIYTNVDSNCFDTNAFSIPAGSVTLGQYATSATPAPFTYTLTFSQPVNNIRLAIGGMGGVTYTTQESFAFNTNGGVPTLTSCKGCFGNINGNTVTASLASAGAQSSGISAGGILTITSPNNYTTLTISGPGGVYGSTFAICSNSIAPQPVVTLGCVYSSNGTNNYLYDVTNNTSLPVTIPVDQQPNPNLYPFSDTHTSTKYWRNNRWNTIKEWNPTTVPNVLTLSRTIAVQGFPYPAGSNQKQFGKMQAINNTTLLTAVSTTSQSTPSNQYVGLWTNTITRFNISTNTVGSAQQTPLFNVYAPASALDAFLLTTTNKLITVGRRGTGVDQSNFYNYYLSQYSYPDGALELDISLATYLPSPGSGTAYFVSLFESNNGKLYLKAGSSAALQSKIYEINLNSPYTLTQVWDDASQRTFDFNSSIDCNIAALTPVPTPLPSPPISNNLGCIYYNFGGWIHNYNPITNTSGPQIELPNYVEGSNSQNDTHTLNRSWRAGYISNPPTSTNYTSIFFQEWVTTNNPLTLASNRVITLPLLYGPAYYSFAVNNDTMLSIFSTASGGATTGLIDATVYRINIVNNTITPAQMTPLFNVGPVNQNTLGFTNMLLTTTNKLLYIATRTANSTTIAEIYQYSYPDGALEGIIPVPQIVPSFFFAYLDIFEQNGNIFFSIKPSLGTGPDTLTTTVYQVNPNPPYNFTLVGPIQNPMPYPGIIVQGLNSSLNCNTTHFNIPNTPLPTPTPSPSRPSTVFNTIYKYLDIQLT